MKNKLIVICIIFSIVLVGCGKKNKQEVTEPTSDTTISTTEEQTQEEQEKQDISIFTKDMEISYEKFISKDGSFESDEKYNNMVKDFIAKLDEDKLPQLTKDEEIRVNFNDNIPKNKGAKLSTTYIKQNGELIVSDSHLEMDENGFSDFKHSYDDKDKYLEGVIYEVTVELEDEVCKYAFAFKIDNKTTPNNKSYALTGYLTSDEQKVYDNYKQDKNIKALANNEPLTMLKFYTQAVMEEEYSLAYSLYQDYNNTTEENYIKAMKGFSKETREDYISNLKAAVDGKFIEDTKEKGYIEYELVKDHPMAIDMIKDSNGIWKTQYMPIQ